MNRRNVLIGFAGLAAVAVSGPSMAFLPRSDRDRLVEQMRNYGRIHGQTFRLDEPAPIVFRDLECLTITSCEFIWTMRYEGPYLVIHDSACYGCFIGHCNFHDTRPPG